MGAERKRKKAEARGVILGPCPFCKGTGKIPKRLPFGANPKAPATHTDRLGFETCPRCKGSGNFGAE